MCLQQLCLNYADTNLIGITCEESSYIIKYASYLKALYKKEGENKGMYIAKLNLGLYPKLCFLLFYSKWILTLILCRNQYMQQSKKLSNVD